MRDYRDPSWVDNGNLLVFNYGIGVIKQGAISPVGAGEPGLKQWFDPPGGLPQVGQGSMRPSQEYGVLSGVTAGHPTPPEPKCVITVSVVREVTLRR